MNFSAATGVGIISLAISGVIGAILPDPDPKPFLAVNDLYVEGQDVVAVRSYNHDGVVVADWHVTIVPVDYQSPVCQTVHGPDEHNGWSRYEGQRENAVSRMNIDKWVGSPSCISEMSAGEYDMFVTWTPRDGTQPVFLHHRFTWDFPA